MTGCASCGSRRSVGHAHRAPASSRGSSTGPVDAQPHVALARRHDAPEARAEPARHPRLERELGRHALAPRTARAPPRASAAARRRRPALDPSISSLSSSVTSPWKPTEPSSVATRGVAQQRRALGMRARRGSRAARGAPQHVLPDRQRRDPDAAADEQRPPLVLRRAEADAQRPEQPQPVAGAQLAQPPRARADVLEQEVEPAVVVAAQDRERARQERPLVRAAAPALARGEHVELPRVRRRPLGVEHRDDVVGAVARVRDDRAEAAAEAARACGRHAPHRASPRACSSCSDTTSGSPCRAARDRARRRHARPTAS